MISAMCENKGLRNKLQQIQLGKMCPKEVLSDSEGFG